MVTVSIQMKKEHVMKVIGYKINNGEKDLRLGPRVRNTLETTQRAKKKARANTPGLMGRLMKVNGVITKSVGTEYTCGRMVVNIMVSGTTMIWKESVLTFILMVSDTTVNISKIKKKVMEYIFGLTVENMKVGGLKENNMDSALTRMLKKSK